MDNSMISAPKHIVIHKGTDKAVTFLLPVFEEMEIAFRMNGLRLVVASWRYEPETGEVVVIFRGFEEGAGVITLISHKHEEISIPIQVEILPSTLTASSDGKIFFVTPDDDYINLSYSFDHSFNIDRVSFNYDRNKISRFYVTSSGDRKVTVRYYFKDLKPGETTKVFVAYLNEQGARSTIIEQLISMKPNLSSFTVNGDKEAYLQEKGRV